MHKNYFWKEEINVFVEKESAETQGQGEITFRFISFFNI